jgi:murein DD-endopeptidase MepM/ murein hydrolase activator NlpD
MHVPVRRLATAALAVAALWSWPIAAPHPIARPYLAPATPYASGHRGIDIRAAAGDEVRAPADGIVHFAGIVVDRPVLSIDQGGGVLSSYEPVVTSLQEGDVVRRGQVIGELLPGHCTSGACLHFGVRIHGEYVSPLLFLGGQPRAVLLPP